MASGVAATMAPEGPAKKTETENGNPNLQATLGPLTEFTCFPRLPKEIQINIWKLTFPGPRVVKLRYSGQGLFTKCTSQARIPIALHVYKFSREVAQHEYKLSFGVKLWSPGKKVRWTFQAKIYFSFDRDILFLDTALVRYCEGLRGMTPDCFRFEASRFQQIIVNVQDLGMVKRLAAWEYLPTVGSYAVVRDEKGAIKSPWDVFESLKGKVMGIELGCQAEEKDMREVVEMDLFSECKKWNMKDALKMITGKDWKRTIIVPFLHELPPDLIARIRSQLKDME